MQCLLTLFFIEQFYPGILRQRRRPTALHGRPVWHLLCELLKYSCWQCWFFLSDCDCVCARVFRVTGAVPSVKPNRLQRQRLRSCRWGQVTAEQTKLVDICSCNSVCLCLCLSLCVRVSDEGDDMQRAGQGGRQNVSGTTHVLLGQTDSLFDGLQQE